ncbi:hypothetical protein HPP92_017111 [Vanilla planifolia]|uniref:GTD-binding domain-containing protein n=1 Tax=Vanilla planifolia TaxID=51239 RepID=A0A835UNA1_VANPL|nr:hypothetical protein HPP92_017666 [Vanilla planifolia]KAG0467783.1 hypothetical protein HPP92_017111 [Vanilla planifolia]
MANNDHKLNNFNFCFRFVFISTSYSFLGFFATLNFSPTCLPEYSLYFFGENDSEPRFDDSDSLMDPPVPQSTSAVPCVSRCSCGCACCSPSSPSSTRPMSEALEEGGNVCQVISVPPVSPPLPAREQDHEQVAGSEGDGELAYMTKMIEKLWVELEEEQNAAATAANEAMSMILRLQREKAELEMESRQFRRLAEERIAHDQGEIATLEDLLLVYRNRLHLSSSVASDVALATLVAEEAVDQGGMKYPRIKCTPSADEDDWDQDIRLTPRKYDFDTSLSTSEHVIRRSYHDGYPEQEAGDGDGNDTRDRVYTIDTVHRGAATAEVDDGDGEERRLMRMELRLAALEQDRDEVQKTVASIRSDIGQVVRLKGVAQQLCKILENI